MRVGRALIQNLTFKLKAKDAIKFKTTFHSFLTVVTVAGGIHYLKLK